MHVGGAGDEVIPMLQYESASTRVAARTSVGAPGHDVTATSSCPANKQSSSQLCVQVSAPDDAGSAQQYSTGVVSVVAAADTNPGNLIGRNKPGGAFYFA